MASCSDSPASSDVDLTKKAPSQGGKEESPFFKEFAEKLPAFATPEEKISFGLQFMRASISQEGSPRFREFWESRKLILPFFKENLNPAIRSNLWNEYVELTVEARKLKEILEEQSAFAMEQIDLAIQAVENDVGRFEELLNSSAEIVFSEASQTIIQEADKYAPAQRELNVLNTLATRLNSLKKEIIKTDMRIRFKTKFFKRLSELGDHVFPRRKELIDKVSFEFERDVERFIDKHFHGAEIVGAPYFAIREEIKALQGMAKVFTLNSAVFTRTRLRLSDCWDKVKTLEKEYKKGLLERKQVSSEQREAMQAKIDALKQRANESPGIDLNREIDELSLELRGVPLQREDVRHLREELHRLREPHLAAKEQKAKELLEAEKERFRIRRESVLALKEKIASFIKEGEGADLETLGIQFAEIEKEIDRMDMSKVERQQLERSLRPLKDFIADRRERSLLNLSEDDKKTLENLREVLKQRKERRLGIKDQIELYRKALGGSNLDFEKAIHCQELLDQERERLDKANAAIEEIEQKIHELEG